ncbi:MAG TPA: hypothetical protein VNH11_21815 [Pirellulales bacterium]|nr:hypothetical protein [Pirellulales bacterium]
MLSGYELEVIDISDVVYHTSLAIEAKVVAPRIRFGDHLIAGYNAGTPGPASPAAPMR